MTDDALNINLHFVETLDDAFEFQRWASQGHPYLAIDTETAGLDRLQHEVRLFQVGNAKEAWAIPWFHWAKLILNFLDNYTGDLVFHNAKFDVGMIEATANHVNFKPGFKLPRHRCHDTAIMANILDPSKPIGLKPLSTRFLHSKLANDETLLHNAMAVNGYTWATVPVDFEVYWLYGAVDTVRTARLYDILYPAVMREAPRAYEVEMATTWILLNMEKKGMEIDIDFATRALEEKEYEIEELAKQCKQEFQVSPGSNSDVLNRLTKLTNYEFTKLTDKGALSLDREVLEDVIEKTDHPLAKMVLSRRRKQKICSAYLRKLVPGGAHSFLGPDGRVHPSFNGNDSYGARTGRMTVSNPALQQLPRSSDTNPDANAVRQCFVATNGGEDHLFVLSDYDQLEARIFAGLAQDEGLIEAINSPEDYFTVIAKGVYGDNTITKKDPRRQVTKNTLYSCVPLDTEILTQRGWIRYDQILKGIDKTLGYNPETGSSEWTTVADVTVSNEKVHTVTFGHNYREFTTTLNHRWPSFQRINTRNNPRKEFKYITTDQAIDFTEYSIILSAKADGGDLNITKQEAAILGWVLSDGSIRRGEHVGAPSQAGGSKVKCEVSITQKKPNRVIEIDDLLNGIPHRRHPSNNDGLYIWYLSPTYARDLLARASITDKDTFDPWGLAINLTQPARSAMLKTLNAGNGHAGDDRFEGFSQGNRTVVTLVEALGYLEGHVSNRSVRQPPKKGWQKKPIDYVAFTVGTMTTQRVESKETSVRYVWCPTTELGTWTMRQPGGPAVLTGNSQYGAGAAKVAETAGVPIEQIEEFLGSFYAQYPGYKRFMKQVDTVAKKRHNDEGVAYVRSLINKRRLPIDDPKHAYKLTNYLCQASATEVLKMANIKLDQIGLGEYMVLNVHDEIILDVPRDIAKDVAVQVEDLMCDDTMFDQVSLTAGSTTSWCWGLKETEHAEKSGSRP